MRIRKLNVDICRPSANHRNFVMLALYWQTLRMKYMINAATGRGYTMVSESVHAPCCGGRCVKSAAARGGKGWEDC